MEISFENVSPEAVFITTLESEELKKAKKLNQITKNRLSGNSFIDEFANLFSIHKKKTIGFYEKQMKLPPNSLTVLFLLHSKISFKEWSNKYLLLCAKELLLDTNYTLDEIGKRLGFASISSFSKWFIRQENQVPSKWRDVLKEKKMLQDKELMEKILTKIHNGELIID